MISNMNNPLLHHHFPLSTQHKDTAHVNVQQFLLAGQSSNNNGSQKRKSSGNKTGHNNEGSISLNQNGAIQKSSTKKKINSARFESAVGNIAKGQPQNAYAMAAVNHTARNDKESTRIAIFKNLQIKPAINDNPSSKIKLSINAPLTTKNAIQPTRNASNNALGSKNSFFNRVMQVTGGGGTTGARNSRNGYQQAANNTTYAANSGTAKLLNSTQMERGLSGASGGRQANFFLGGLQAEDTFDSSTLKD